MTDPAGGFPDPASLRPEVFSDWSVPLPYWLLSILNNPRLPKTNAHYLYLVVYMSSVEGREKRRAYKTDLLKFLGGYRLPGDLVKMQIWGELPSNAYTAGSDLPGLECLKGSREFTQGDKEWGKGHPGRGSGTCTGLYFQEVAAV